MGRRDTPDRTFADRKAMIIANSCGWAVNRAACLFGRPPLCLFRFTHRALRYPSALRYPLPARKNAVPINARQCSTKAILLRRMREKGCFPDGTAATALAALPDTFEAWKRLYHAKTLPSRALEAAE